MNYSHLFPTRYALELEGLKGTVGSETFKEVSQREDSKKQIKKLLEDRYTSGKNKWFFQPLLVRILSLSLFFQPWAHLCLYTLLSSPDYPLGSFASTPLLICIDAR